MDTRWVSFINQHPEWAELSYEVLFRRGEQNLQYVVMQAMMLAYQMGKEGRSPPRPKRMDPRVFPEPAADPEVDKIYEGLKALAWGQAPAKSLPQSRLVTRTPRPTAVAVTNPSSTGVRRVVRRVVR